MGELMALALVCTMMAAVLFQPVLMGPPQRAPSPIVPERRPVSNPAQILSPATMRRVR
jgi:hypothetical protein